MFLESMAELYGPDVLRDTFMYSSNLVEIADHSYSHNLFKKIDSRPDKSVLNSKDIIDEYTIFDFNVPHFRITNDGFPEHDFAYVQRAIDNATAGDTILLAEGEYNQNIIVDKDITLSGVPEVPEFGGPDYAVIIQGTGGGSGSPPLYNSSLPGITVTAEDAKVQWLQVRNFSTGIRIDGASGVELYQVGVVDSQGIGIDVVQSEDVVIFVAEVHRSGGDNIRVDSLSHQIYLQSIGANTADGSGISIASDGSSVKNSNLYRNDLYGCHISGSDATISDTYSWQNGMNGIKLQGVISAIVENNFIYDNGLAEIYMVASYNVEISGNNITNIFGDLPHEDTYAGVGILASASDNLLISRNEMGLSIHLNSSYSQISDNNFTDISGGSVSYDDTAIVISGSYNTISDNTIYNVGVGLLFLYGDYDYNLVENNTLDFTGDDMWYYTSGTNNRFINTDIGIVDIDEDSYFDIRNYVDIEMYTVNGPVTGVELDVHYVDGSSIYLTDNYGGTDSTTDSLGTIKRLFLIYQVFDGNFIPDTIETRITYYYDGAEYNITLDTSISHSEKIWVNLRPVASINQINGVGDILETGSEEAIKGADVVMADSHTIAYWPFNEGSGSTVTDATATAYTGTINPLALWNEGRSNATDDYSVEFDGTFTNIGTNADFDATEFTAEVWFKTDTADKKMVLFSDKAGSKWAYNM